MNDALLKAALECRLQQVYREFTRLEIMENLSLMNDTDNSCTFSLESLKLKHKNALLEHRNFTAFV